MNETNLTIDDLVIEETDAKEIVKKIMTNSYMPKTSDQYKHENYYTKSISKDPYNTHAVQYFHDKCKEFTSKIQNLENKIVLLEEKIQSFDSDTLSELLDRLVDLECKLATQDK
jgi:uncharacterized coiled-coil protein SlyX